MNIWQAIILGIVQGLTEFLPVSSSGHLTIFQHIMGVNAEGNLFFNVMLHVGTLVSVCTVYHKLIIRLIKAFFSALPLRENLPLTTTALSMLRSVSLSTR